MDKTWALALVMLCLSNVETASTFCRRTRDCGVEKRCCDHICLARRSCDGTCTIDVDCDENFGEKCVNKSCECVNAPCEAEATTVLENGKHPCDTDSRCIKNETCINGLCQILSDPVSQTPSLSPTVLAIVATVGLVIFACAFYFCLKQQHTSRPSLAAKEAHVRAMERSRSTLSDRKVSFDECTDKANSRRSSEHSRLSNNSTGSTESPEVPTVHGKGISRQEGGSKIPTSSLFGSVELSAIIEEDEISEVTVK